jgi:mannose-6-phosphate isomerase-like protein (cupin superfamily)
MRPTRIRLPDKFAQFSDHWNPRIVGRYNGNELRVAKLSGEFTWHSHPDTDELFLVVKGRLRLQFRDGVEVLDPGDTIVVPRGVEHCPTADGECHVLMIDAEGAVNTGSNAEDARTRLKLETI